jgi:hypothetical protein
MGYTQVALEDKILDMYPEIRKYSISPRLSFNEGGNAWVVKLVKGKEEKVVNLSKQDADACMDNTYCEAFKDELCDAIKTLEK